MHVLKKKKKISKTGALCLNQPLGRRQLCGIQGQLSLILQWRRKPWLKPRTPGCLTPPPPPHPEAVGTLCCLCISAFLPLDKAELRQSWLCHWRNQLIQPSFPHANDIFMLGACWFSKQLAQWFADDTFIWNFAPATLLDWATTHPEKRALLPSHCGILGRQLILQVMILALCLKS